MVRVLVVAALLLGACKGSSSKEREQDPPAAAPVAAAPATVPGLRLDDPAWIPPDVVRDFWTTEAPCPEGAGLRGAPPPRGTAVWCETADGARHGGYAEWHARGAKLASIGLYERGERNGLWTSYYDTGKKQSEQTFKAGKPHGMQRTYWPTGDRESDGWYREGVPNGTFTAYDGSGGPSGSTVVQDGTGTIALVHPNGTKRIEYQLVSGKRSGLEKTFDEAGHALTETTYRAGERAGPFTRWNAAGQVVEKGEYQRDMKHGAWIQFGADGAETTRVQYDKGEVVP
jgi:antitoxin component YwqK of YwqJK toxin-antitoxin module